MTVIRAASLADAAAFQAIYAPYVLGSTATLENVPPTVEEMRGRLAPMLDQGYPVLAAERDGRVIGYAYAGPAHKRPAYRPTVENTIYLAQGETRGGVGAALMAELMAAAEAAGFRQMIAVIADAENRASLSFHARQGFEQVAHWRAVAWKFGRWLDVFHYQKTLGVGDRVAPVEDGPACPAGPPTFR